ncbi:MAG: hydantoinase/oxoprolinase family protein, partial [Dehalococcoidia bacterium]
RAVRKVADPLGMSVTEAARSIFTSVNSFMADNITEVTTKRGHDVRDFTLVAGGGAGPVHGGYMAKQLGIDTVIIPRQAALYSAFGMLAMDIGRHYSCSYISLNDRIDIDRVNRLYEEMEGEAFRAFADIDIPEKDVIFQRTAEMRYLGQFHEVEVEIPLHSLKAQDLGEILSRFHQRHTELYTFAMPERRVEFLTFHLLATARREPLSLREFAPAGEEPSAALKRRRLCLFPEEKEYRDTPVYDGAKLAPGNIIRGPAIVEEETTTVLIPEGFKCSVDKYKDYLLGRVT